MIFTDKKEEAVEIILQQKPLVIFQNKSEWGPRALGNRSILFDPRNPDAKDIVNTFKKIQMVGEVYISHVIYQMLLDGKQFYSNQVTNFIDWGTQEDWDKYTNERL